ncbi:hypothetical protein OFC62_26910, partial [Escherichia coli]|nr:hypothetical protein [Escherichia coli]
ELLKFNVPKRWFSKSYFNYLREAPNKAFKSDSQRLAFSVQGWVSCLRRNGLGLVVALLTP